ncbi:MAG: DNA cytosine methyltransferase [Paeniclostridium sordellii]|nr:DNA cytosine methyltransferase [Paeniclostridium sordellii]
MSLTFLDFFSGVGGFRRGMEMAGHKCLGHCEIDKYANLSYNEIHSPDKEEWYGNDIRNTRADELPRAECWCFGFPCQDISIAGKQVGFKGERSSLFFTITRLIRDTKEEDRPKYLFIENVKNLLSVNGGTDFLKLLIELDEIGYDAEWQVLNSKNFGVPQNRERVFIVGHFRGSGTRKVFPINRNNSKIIETIGYIGKKKTIYQVNNINGICRCLDTMSGGNRQPKILVKENTKNGYIEECEGFRIRKLTPKECWRLQGWKDEDFEKAAKVCSDTQLYKQAGNGVTVTVVYKIDKRLKIDKEWDYEK